MAKGTHNYLEDDRNKDIKIYVNGNREIYERDSGTGAYDCSEYSDYNYYVNASWIMGN